MSIVRDTIFHPAFLIWFTGIFIDVEKYKIFDLIEDTASPYRRFASKDTASPYRRFASKDTASPYLKKSNVVDFKIILILIIVFLIFAK